VAFIVGGLATAGGVLALARRHGSQVTQRLGRDRRASGEDGEWTCACGTRFRTVGAGRHQVLWLLEAPESEPVLGDLCPSCERPLPGRTG
jgi:hypothetical protein